MDPSLSPYNMEAERYHQLARAALFQSSLSELATQYAVEALVIVFFWIALSDKKLMDLTVSYELLPISGGSVRNHFRTTVAYHGHSSQYWTECEFKQTLFHWRES